jgi:hypothetical protein
MWINYSLSIRNIKDVVYIGSCQLAYVIIHLIFNQTADCQLTNIIRHKNARFLISQLASAIVPSASNAQLQWLVDLALYSAAAGGWRAAGCGLPGSGLCVVCCVWVGGCVFPSLLPPFARGC